MHFQVADTLFVGAVVALSMGRVAGTGLCMMVYQMADNNLEFFLRQDNHELLQSQAIQSELQNTWVYFDARGYGNNQDITEPLEDVWDSTGTNLLSDLGGKYTGSRYLHWENGKMVAETTLPGEQNSDSPAVMEAFLVHALTDCVAWGATEYFLAFSSHGGGFAGYGGDDYKGRRHLLSYNNEIVGAIQASLGAVSGAPTKLDVIGFDACLMQAFGVIDDYRVVAHYVLASEAVEPGHGWAYNTLTSVSGSALDLATDIINEFVDQTQGRNHLTPKILSVISTDGYTTFLEKFEAFMGELNTLLAAQDDQDLYTLIGRARMEAVSFEGIVDARDTRTPSALDIGSFLSSFQLMCGPTGDLGTYLEETIAAYDQMILLSRYGEGTLETTGMHITWPYKSDYLDYRDLWNAVLFNIPEYKTSAAPNYLQFLETYLTGSSPTEATSTVCLQQLRNVPVEDDGILVTPSAEVSVGSVQIKTNLSTGCDYLSIEYGVDLSTPLSPFLGGLGIPGATDDFLFLYGGDILGTFNDASVNADYSATWDRSFYFLTIGASSFEALYVFDRGNGYKSAPVIYIPEANVSNLGTVQLLDFLFWDLDTWKTEVGARYGYLTFSRNPTTGTIDQNLVLYVATPGDGQAGESFDEVLPSQGGVILPIVYVKAFISGYSLNFLPGGFNQTILTWSESINYEIIARTDERILLVTGADAVVLDITAVDFDWYTAGNGTDYVSFDIIGGEARGQTGLELGEVTSSASNVTFGIGLLSIFVLLFSFL